MRATTNHKKAIPIRDLDDADDPVLTAFFRHIQAPDGSAQALKLGLALQECADELTAALGRPDLDPRLLPLKNSEMHGDEVRRVKERVKP